MVECSVCNRLVERSNIINAKEWNKTSCNYPKEDPSNCQNYQCRYNEENGKCIEFYFCDKCFSDKSLLEMKFESVMLFKSSIFKKDEAPDDIKL